MSSQFSDISTYIGGVNTSSATNESLARGSFTNKFFNVINDQLQPCETYDGEFACGAPIINRYTDGVEEVIEVPSVNEEILRTVKNKSGRTGNNVASGKGKKKFPAKKSTGSLNKNLISNLPTSGEEFVYAEGTTAGEDLDYLLAASGNTSGRRLRSKLTQLPELTEVSQGIFAGRFINQSLLPQEIPAAIDIFGNQFGGPYAAVFIKAIERYNGFGILNNTVNYNDPWKPGSLNRPFVVDNFYLTYEYGNNNPNSQRINQWNVNPAGWNPTGSYAAAFLPTGVSSDLETEGLCLAVNGKRNRGIILLRRLQPYYFTFQLQSENKNIPCTANQYNKLDLLGGMYFTSDCVGGSEYNYINNISSANPTPSSAVVQVAVNLNVGRLTEVVRPGSSIAICITQSWPDVLFYQSASGPFQGGICQVIGNFGLI
jgi:hypothetical protein